MASISDVMGGLEILRKYATPDDDMAAEHDVIYAPGGRKVSKEDRAALEKLGWFWDDEFHCWARFT